MMHSQMMTNKNIVASIKNLEAQISQFSKKIVAQENAGMGFNDNIVDNPKNENRSAIRLRSKGVETSTRVSYEKKKSEEKLLSVEDRKKKGEKMIKMVMMRLKVGLFTNL